MALHQLLYGGSTCSPLQWARCEWPLPLQRRCGPPGSAPSSITVSRAAVGTEEEEEEEGGWVTLVAEHQADTSRDKMVGEPKEKDKKPTLVTPLPSPAQKRERRQMRRRIKKRWGGGGRGDSRRMKA